MVNVLEILHTIALEDVRRILEELFFFAKIKMFGKLQIKYFAVLLLVDSVTPILQIFS